MISVYTSLFWRSGSSQSKACTRDSPLTHELRAGEPHALETLRQGLNSREWDGQTGMARTPRAENAALVAHFLFMLRWFPLPLPNSPLVSASSLCCCWKASSPGESKLPVQAGASAQGSEWHGGAPGQGAVRGAHRQQAGPDGEDGPEGQHPARRLDGAVRPLA